MKAGAAAALLLVPITAGSAVVGWVVGRHQVAQHRHAAQPAPQVATAAPQPLTEAVVDDSVSTGPSSDTPTAILEAAAPPEPLTPTHAHQPETVAESIKPAPAAPAAPPPVEVAQAVAPAPTPPITAAPLDSTQPPAPAPSKPRAPVLIVVSLPSQRAFVFRDGELWASTRVSTGKARKRTPIGRYTILEKQVHHRSRTYDNAPMPYMQRLTWGGVALHAGHVPNFPASHGCIRLPWAFAKRLYGITNYSTVVVVTDKRAPSSKEAWNASHPGEVQAG